MDDPKDLKPGLPVAGYRPQSDAAIALVNGFKADEERLRRAVESLYAYSRNEIMGSQTKTTYNLDDLSDGWKYIRMGFMLLNRAVFQPGRVKLPEDGE